MGGMDAGGFGPFTTPSAVASFLSALRNDLGGTNIRFTVESVQGTNHKDSWTADNGTGTCDADWTKQADGSWKIHSDKITFTPTDPNVLCCDYVKEAFNYFEASYNANFTEQCGACYTDKCHVTVNGGMDAGGFGPFTTPSAVASFLSALRNDLGGTNIRFTVESVQGTNHKDSWTADNGTGTCDADWTKQADGSWKIHSDKITFTPKPAHDAATAKLVNSSIRPSLLDSCRGAESTNQSFTGKRYGMDPPPLRPAVSRMGVTQVVRSDRESKLYSK